MSSEPHIDEKAERLLFVGSYAAHKAASAPSQEIATRLEALGHHVVLASSRPSALGKLLDTMTVIAALRPLPDVAHVDLFSGRAFFLAEIAIRLLARQKIPTIVTLHGGGLVELADHSPRRVERVLAGATRVTAPSRFLQEAMSRFRHDIELVPNPIELSRYRLIPERSTSRLLWLRAYHKTYNPRLAVDVLNLLRDKRQGAPCLDEARLTMVGPDKGDGSRRATERRVRSLGLDDVVEIRGGVDKLDVPDVLVEGDVFLNTSNVDNTPVTVIEAMASGVPVVSTDVGGTSSLLSNGELGILVPPDDPESMARAVRSTLTDRTEALDRAKRARNAVESFDWQHVLPKWRELIRATADKRPASATQRGRL